MLLRTFYVRDVSYKTRTNLKSCEQLCPSPCVDVTVFKSSLCFTSKEEAELKCLSVASCVFKQTVLICRFFLFSIARVFRFLWMDFQTCHRKTQKCVSKTSQEVPDWLLQSVKSKVEMMLECHTDANCCKCFCETVIS